MTEAQLKALTLGDIEQIASRVKSAARDFAKASSLFGRSADVDEDDEPEEQDDLEPAETPPQRGRKGKKRPPIDEDAARAHRARQFQPVESDVPKGLRRPRTNHPGGDLTPAERMQRNRLLSSRQPVDPNLPEDMQAAERGEPP